MWLLTKEIKIALNLSFKFVDNPFKVKYKKFSNVNKNVFYQ